MPRAGVLGTMVWDTIHARDPGREAPVEEWGGIAYALSAFDAAADPGWTLFPIIKVGADLREEADAFLSRLRRVDSLDGVRTVPEPNNRVELLYRDGGRRTERLRGGVPGWSWEELRPLARACDALYVNFIAGWELDLPAARHLRLSFDGLLYCDIHSLLLGLRPDGTRYLRPPAEWREWFACFEIVQVNDDELGAVARGWGDPWKLAAEVVGGETRALLVTLGERGSAWVATADFLRRTGGSAAPEPDRAGLRRGGPVLSGRVSPARVVRDADPTGCGDVWGVTCFASLLGGRSLEASMARANELAARNAALRGAGGLAEALRSDSGIVRNGRR